MDRPNTTKQFSPPAQVSAASAAQAATIAVPRHGAAGTPVAAHLPAIPDLTAATTNVAMVSDKGVPKLVTKTAIGAAPLSSASGDTRDSRNAASLPTGGVGSLKTCIRVKSGALQQAPVEWRGYNNLRSPPIFHPTEAELASPIE